MHSFIHLNAATIDQEHICCAFSDKKCAETYQKKKEWLKNEFKHGYVFYRLNERAKVFIEYGPAEKAWVPITAKNQLNINCFWVSGKYKKQGYGKLLLNKAIDDAKKQNKDALVSIVGKKKFHFMSDTKWLIHQGFEIIDETKDGFVLLQLKLNANAELPSFNTSVKKPIIPTTHDLVVYYSNRCPFAEYHVLNSLKESAEKRNISLKAIHLSTMKEAQNCPSPATIFSLFYKGKFITTDVSVCLDSRFDKLIAKVL